jgi:DNA-binding FadR family transcriptional regulator
MEFKMDHVQRNTLSQQVLEQIIYLLMKGHLNPGDKLPPEMELMEQFDVSRPVLREALSSLEALEIVKRRPRDGTYINKKVGSSPFRAMLALSINDVPAVMEARIALELGLVTIAAEKIQASQLAQLKETIVKIGENKDDDYGMYDKKFHKIIATTADNQIVEGMIDSLLISHEKTDSLIAYREPEITMEHHTAIYEALKQNNPIESFKQMFHHLNYVRDKILSNYKG